MAGRRTRKTKSKSKIAPVNRFASVDEIDLKNHLEEAIDDMEVSELRDWVKRYVVADQEVASTIADRHLVFGKQVVRYHEDTASENGIYSEGDEEREVEEVEQEQMDIEMGEGADDDENLAHDDADDADDEEDYEETNKQEEKKEVQNKREPMRLRAAKDDMLVPRMATCERCNQKFDVTNNKRGDCLWHDDEKEMNARHPIWKPIYPKNTDWMIEKYGDDPIYQVGFTWYCCKKDGNSRGCHSTKHKTRVNQVIPYPPPRVKGLGVQYSFWSKKNRKYDT